jgi:hypothetical protein
MKRYILIILMSTLCKNSFAQKQNDIWYFGGVHGYNANIGAGITFNSGKPVAINNNPMTTQEGTAVMSDANGNLYFLRMVLMFTIRTLH